MNVKFSRYIVKELVYETCITDDDLIDLFPEGFVINNNNHIQILTDSLDADNSDELKCKFITCEDSIISIDNEDI